MNKPTDLKKPTIVWTPWNFISFVLVVGVMVAFCAVWRYIGFWEIVFNFRINNVSTTATVTETKVIQDYEDGPSYHVLYEYDVNGVKYANSTTYPKLVWQDMKPGDKIRIRYFAPLAGDGSVLDE